MIEVNICHKRSVTLPLPKMEKELILKGEADTGFRAATIIPINQEKRRVLSTFSEDDVGGDGSVGYRSHTSHSSSQRGDSTGDCARHVIRSKYINHLSLFNVGESVNCVGRIGYRSWTVPSPSNHSVDLGISSGFYIYGDNRSSHWSHTSQLYAYKHGRLNISHPRYPQ